MRYRLRSYIRPSLQVHLVSHIHLRASMHIREQEPRSVARTFYAQENGQV